MGGVAAWGHIVLFILLLSVAEAALGLCILVGLRRTSSGLVQPLCVYSL